MRHILLVVGLIFCFNSSAYADEKLPTHSQIINDLKDSLEKYTNAVIRKELDNTQVYLNYIIEDLEFLKKENKNDETVRHPITEVENLILNQNGNVKIFPQIYDAISGIINMTDHKS